MDIIWTSMMEVIDTLIDVISSLETISEQDLDYVSDGRLRETK